MFVWKLDVCMETICSYGNYDCLECLYGKYIFVLKIYFCMENICLYGKHMFVCKLYVFYGNYVCMDTICLYGNFVYMETMFIWKHMYVWKLYVLYGN